MKDSFGREITYLRVSVTERCNLNCVYCGKADCGKKENELTPREIRTIASAFVACGIRKIRLTGGEPLVRGDIERIVEAIRDIPQLQTLTLTTNGVYLKQFAAALRRAGLDSVNISLDSTDGSTYRKLTGADVLHRVLDGVDAAMRAGLSPMKINAVLMRGVNDDGAADLIALARERPIDVRFIELMPFSDAGEDASRIVTGDELLRRFPFLTPTDDRDGTARMYAAPGFQGRVGLISPVSHRFCGACNRVRLLSDGKVKPCLGDDAVYDVRSYLSDADALTEQIRQIILKKPAGHHFGEAALNHGLNRTGG